MEQLLSQLNDSQRRAVTYCDGPQLVIAGAGSGKTRVLTYKIAYLMKQGMKPENILALTFTNKAANEMKDRIGKLIGIEAYGIRMGSFHTCFAYILRCESKAIGFKYDFTIYDNDDSVSVVKGIIKELGLDDKQYKASSIFHRISNAKNNLELAEDYVLSADNRRRDLDARVPETGRIYKIYQERLKAAYAMDFDDLLIYTYLLFRDHEDIRLRYSNQYKYILVDEYQDTNAVQQMILLQLSAEHQRICVVGDDAQSIYGFRGANIDNILDFQQKFENTQLFKLEQNYRSTQTIVKAANSLITHNQRQIPKEVYSMNDQGEKLQLKHAYSDKEEAMIVSKDIRQIKRQEHAEWSDFAILYRTNSQSRTFEDQFRRDGIPYRIYGGMSFYQRKEVKDVIAYLRVCVNPSDEEALKRIINYPKRGLGSTTIDKVLKHAHAIGVAPWNVVEQPLVAGLDVNKGTMTKLQGFASQMQTYIDEAATTDAYTLGRRLVEEMGVAKEIYSGKDIEDLSRQENFQELLSSMQDFVETKREEGDEEHAMLTDFLQEVSLMTDLDSDDDSQSRVSLMTVHSAKGLEFQTVFVVGMEENIFPSPMSSDTARGLEEERRLLYVAITRAERHCILTSAQSRYRYGRMEYDTPSRFLKDIDQRYMAVYDIKSGSDIPFETDNYRSQPRWGMQNSRPVASQFQADPMPKVTRPRREETPVNPFSERFVKTFEASGGRSSALNAGRGVEQSQRQSSSTQATASQPRRLKSMAQINAAARYSAPSAPMASYNSGDRVEHDRFGRGTVICVEGTGENQKATVEFDNAGTKQLLLKFAKLRKI